MSDSLLKVAKEDRVDILSNNSKLPMLVMGMLDTSNRVVMVHQVNRPTAPKLVVQLIPTRRKLIGTFFSCSQLMFLATMPRWVKRKPLRPLMS